MILFSILWIPSLYMFVEALQQPRDPEKKGLILAVLGGCLLSVMTFFIPNLLPEGAFGFMRWLHGFVDVIAVPVLLPLLFRYMLQIRYLHQSYIEIHQFVLVWLIPVALVKSIQWNFHKDAILLVLTPLLWGAQAIGIPWALEKAEEEIGFKSFLSYTTAVLLPLLASTAYWAFFSKLYATAVPAALLSMLPSIWWLVKTFRRMLKG